MIRNRKILWISIGLGILLFIVVLLVIIFYCKLTKKWTKEKHENNNNITEFNLLLKNKLNNNSDLFRKNISNIPIIYINLERSKNRRENIEKQIIKYNIPNIRRSEGIDGKMKDLYHDFIYSDILGKIEYTNKYKLDEYSKVVKNPHGELGCLLSHLKIIIEAHHKGIDLLMICEDDVDFSPILLWEKTLNDLIKSYPADWTIINLYSPYCEYNKDQIKTWVGNIRDTFKKNCFSCTCYLINRKGIENIYNNIMINPYSMIISKDTCNKKCNIWADTFLYDRAKFCYIHINPPLIAETFYPSEIVPGGEIRNSGPVFEHYKKIIKYYVDKNNIKFLTFAFSKDENPIPNSKNFHSTGAGGMSHNIQGYIIPLLNRAKELNRKLVLPPPSYMLGYMHNNKKNVPENKKWSNYLDFSNVKNLIENNPPFYNNKMGQIILKNKEDTLKYYDSTIPSKKIDNDIKVVVLTNTTTKKRELHSYISFNKKINKIKLNPSIKIKDLVSKLKLNFPYIFIHIRRGDMKKKKNLGKHYKVCTNISYIINFIKKIKNKVKSIIIATNEENSKYKMKLNKELKKLFNKVIWEDDIMKQIPLQFIKDDNYMKYNIMKEISSNSKLNICSHYAAITKNCDYTLCR